MRQVGHKVAVLILVCVGKEEYCQKVKYKRRKQGHVEVVEVFDDSRSLRPGTPPDVRQQNESKDCPDQVLNTDLQLFPVGDHGTPTRKELRCHISKHECVEYHKVLSKG